MVRAWYIDEDPTNEQAPHHQNPPKYVTLEDLRRLTGVECFLLNVKTFDSDGMLEKIKKERACTFEDEVTMSRECLSDYETKVELFYKEHLHTDDEIRFCLEGSGYFDVRDLNDDWIRIEITPGDMLILPRGIYHRFTLDVNDYIRVKRFLQGSLGGALCQAHNRPADNLDCRKNYLKQIEEGLQISA